MNYGARNFARKFYSSRAWESKSKAYRKNHPCCEKCLKRGLVNPSKVVHHKIHIDELNWRDAAILFNDENLEALCMDCHAEEHREVRGEQFAPDGTLILEDDDESTY